MGTHMVIKTCGTGSGSVAHIIRVQNIVEYTKYSINIPIICNVSLFCSMLESSTYIIGYKLYYIL